MCNCKSKKNCKKRNHTNPNNPMNLNNPNQRCEKHPNKCNDIKPDIDSDKCKYKCKCKCKRHECRRARDGRDGRDGTPGLPGCDGEDGEDGCDGEDGEDGEDGRDGRDGSQGPPGSQGSPGESGSPGIDAVVCFSNFYTIVTTGPPVHIVAGSSIIFDTDGPSNGIITRVNTTQFNLPNIGTYEIYFEVNINGTPDSVVVINGTEIAYTNTNTQSGEIVRTFLIVTTTINSIISINNPAASTTDIILSNKVSANHLIIKQIA